MKLSIAVLSLAAVFCNAASLQRRAAVDDCLSQASVPTDKLGTAAWNADVKPFNSRVSYTPAAVAVPTTIAQIQASVNCGRSAGVKVTAKSGGHSYASLGLGGRDGHLVIVLDRRSWFASPFVVTWVAADPLLVRHVQRDAQQSDQHCNCAARGEAWTCRK